VFFGAFSGAATWSAFGTPVGATGDPSLRPLRAAFLALVRRSAASGMSSAADMKALSVLVERSSSTV
jgi:hypothetical protein